LFTFGKISSILGADAVVRAGWAQGKRI